MVNFDNVNFDEMKFIALMLFVGVAFIVIMLLLLMGGIRQCIEIATDEIVKKLKEKNKE